MQKSHDLTLAEMAAIIDKLSDEDKMAYQRDLTAFGRGCIYHAADGSYRYMPANSVVIP